MSASSNRFPVLLLLAATLVTGCGGDMDDLNG